MKWYVAALVLAASIGCAKEQAPTRAGSAEEQSVDDSAERASLLDLAHGATVTDRTGEAMLEVSALRAIDGDPASFWMTPPHDLPQSMIIALPARSRIDKVGIRTIAKGGFTANHVAFECSLDGRAFTPLATIKSADTSDPQLFDVKPAEATSLRVTMVDSLLPQHDVRLCSILARGAELESPHPGDITGCWIVNGREARFARRGAHVIGVLEMGREPIRFDGGFDGRIYRLNWIRGNDYGMALITVAPDGRHLSGIEWHEEVVPLFFGDSWFGEKRTCAASIADAGEVALGLLRRVGRFSLYALRFRSDESLDVEASSDVLRSLIGFTQNRKDLRFVAHEFRQPTPARNREVSQRLLASLRQQLESTGVNVNGIDFVAQGSADPRQQPTTESMRALYSSVDLEIRR